MSQKTNSYDASAHGLPELMRRAKDKPGCAVCMGQRPPSPYDPAGRKRYSDKIEKCCGKK